MAGSKQSSAHIKFSWGAALLIAFGVIFLMQNFGALSGNVLTILSKLWPVLLIFAGLHILYNKHH